MNGQLPVRTFTVRQVLFEVIAHYPQGEVVPVPALVIVAMGPQLHEGPTLIEPFRGTNWIPPNGKAIPIKPFAKDAFSGAVIEGEHVL